MNTNRCERPSLWREPTAKNVTAQQQQVGYPRVIGYIGAPGAPPPPPPQVHPAMAPAAVMVPPGHPLHPMHPHGMHPAAFRPGHHGGHDHHMHEYYGHGQDGYGYAPQPLVAPVHQPHWREMVAPGTPPVGEGHVPIPLNPETFGGIWGAGGATTGSTITFSTRPQKPFKMSRLIVRATKSGSTAIGNLIGQVFVGSDLQQGDVGNLDLESLGAANAFDTWVSFKQAEPGVWIRVLATLTAFPTGESDFELYTLTALGHYFH